MGSPGLWDLYKRLSGESRTVLPWKSMGRPIIQVWEPETSSPAWSGQMQKQQLQQV